GRSRIEGRLAVTTDLAAAKRAVEAGAELDDGTLILSRTIAVGGRSRATAGGASVPAATLTAVAADLVMVHGQSDQQQLLSAAAQRDCLDAFAGAPARRALADYAATYDELHDVSAELHEVTTRARERAQEADLVRLGLGEIEAVNPAVGEDVDLVAEESRLAHTDALRRAAQESHDALSGDAMAPDATSALALVALARKGLDVEREHDPTLAEISDRLAAASYALADVVADIASYAAGMDADPLRLAAVQERRAELARLTRKYGDDVDAVLAWARAGAERLTQLQEDDSRVRALRHRHDELGHRLADAAAALTKRRAAAGDRLAKAVSRELAGLAMSHTVFQVRLTRLSQPSRSGVDEVTFSLSAPDGGDERALDKGASGGELSRIMLALEVCLADSAPVPTMVFDEVDSGVGGKAAVEIGRRLARLARSVQVIVVTHLPQVAAFADRHYVVTKSDGGLVTTSDVSVLDEAGRRTELSRMLAGLEGSESALAHADELVGLARAERASS
ncbi:MAG: DNA repair protein RecN, partial [Nocardioidaceae bacterium]